MFVIGNKQRKSRVWGILISSAISLGLLFIAFRGLNFNELIIQLSKINLAYIPLLIVLYLSTFIVRAYRWSILLPNREKLSLNELFQTTMVGMFANLVLPLRAGELVRPWMLSKWQPVSFSAGLASIFTERMFDILTILGLLALCLTKIQSAPPLVIIGSKAIAVFALFVIGLMVVAYRYPNFILIPAEKFLKLFSKADNPIREKLKYMIEEFILGLKTIATIGDLFLVILSSVFLWLLIAIFYQAIFWSLGESPSFWVSITLNSMIALAVAAPSAPGFIGTFQFGCYVALTMVYNYSIEFSAAYSIVSHAFQFVLTVIIGMWVLYKKGLSWVR